MKELCHLIDDETGLVQFNRRADVPAHLGNMIVVGKGRKLEDRTVDVEGNPNHSLWMIGPDCKYVIMCIKANYYRRILYFSCIFFNLYFFRNCVQFLVGAHGQS